MSRVGRADEVPGFNQQALDEFSHNVGITGTITPVEAALLTDGQDGRLEQHDLLTASLIASGVQQSGQLATYRAKFASHAERLARKLPADATEWERASRVLEFMHREILTGSYCPQLSSVATALDAGDYNCVSSAILFNSLAKRVGLEPVAAETIGHAVSRLEIDGRTLNIETTCPQWFAFYGTQAAPPAATQYRELSETGLVAAIYYNRGYEALAQGQFNEAAWCNLLALRLDGANHLARGNFLAVLNNWSIERCEAGDLTAAEQLLRQGIQLAPNYAAFADNLRAVVQRRQLVTQ